MCGRYALFSDHVKVAKKLGPASPPEDWKSGYNIAPGTDIVGVRFSELQDHLLFDRLWWGYRPHWADESAPRPSETTWNHRPGVEFGFNSRDTRAMRYLSLIALTLAYLALTGMAMATEEAEYDVVQHDGDFELCDYAPQVVAEVVVSGSFSRAGNSAFRPLFNYISGDNTVQEKIAMTAPVSQTAQGQDIAMTSPVGQSASGDDWVVSFMMPAEFTMDTILKPTDPAVNLREIPAHRRATIRYSGRWAKNAINCILKRYAPGLQPKIWT